MTLHVPTLKNAVDAVSTVAAIGALAKIIPVVAALLSAVWTSIRIYEWARGKLRSDIDYE
jgi:hypothetical protein